MVASISGRRGMSAGFAAVVVLVVAASFLAGERVGVAMASRSLHSPTRAVAAAISRPPAQDQGDAAPAPEATESPGPSADCNTNYR